MKGSFGHNLLPLCSSPGLPALRRRPVYFPESQPVLLGGKCCTPGRAELQILQQDRAKNKASARKDGGPVLGTFTATSPELQSTFAGPFAAGEFGMAQRDREMSFQDLQPQLVLTDPRLGANSSPVSGLGQELPGMKIRGWCRPKMVLWETQGEEIQTFPFSSETSCN